MSALTLPVQDSYDHNSCEFDDSDFADEFFEEFGDVGEQPANITDMGMVYFCGYVAHAFLKKTNCTTCKTFMCKQNATTDRDKLIKFRQFQNTMLGLKYPTSKFVKIIQLVVDIFEKCFAEMCYQPNIIGKIKILCINKLKLECCSIAHQIGYIEHTLKVLLRAKLKQINQKCKNSKKKFKKLDIMNHV